MFQKARSTPHSTRRGRSWKPSIDAEQKKSTARSACPSARSSCRVGPCHGFCIFNNIAIGARYAQTRVSRGSSSSTSMRTTATERSTYSKRMIQSISSARISIPIIQRPARTRNRAEARGTGLRITCRCGGVGEQGIPGCVPGTSCPGL